LRKALKLAAWISLFAGLVVLTVFAALELDHALTVKLEALKTGSMLALERIVGRTITYGEISPSFFRSINVRDIAVHDSNDPGHTLLSIHELRVYYSCSSFSLDRIPLGQSTRSGFSTAGL